VKLLANGVKNVPPSRPTLSAKERRRLFVLHGGLCHVCRLSVDPVKDRWDIEHVIPRAMFRDPREADTDGNMKPCHYNPCHVQKTKADIGRISKAKRTQNKHEGMKRSKYPPMMGTKASGWKRKMDGSWERR
jgi:5-methylcytosine-specific restriction protein A